MNTIELGKKLKEMYETPGAKKATMVHLFGIIYAIEIKKEKGRVLEILKVAGVKESYQAEINKGINLAKYVEVKPENLNHI